MEAMGETTERVCDYSSACGCRACRDATIYGLYRATRRAISLARVYAAEGGGHRMAECLTQVRSYRDRIRGLRAA
jgi:hypothetical protein